MFDFSINQTVDSIESVPEDFRGLYVEAGDGKFKLNSGDEGVRSAVSAIVRLNGALKNSRSEVDTLKKGRVDLSPLSEYGDSVETIAEGVKTKLAEAGKGKKADENAIRQQITQEVAATHKSETDALKQSNKKLQQQLFQNTVVSAATSALSPVAVSVDLAMPHVLSQVKAAVNDDGTYGVEVVDAEGATRFSGTTGSKMTVAELVAEMKGKDDFAPLFKSDIKSGGGSQPSSQRRSSPVGGRGGDDARSGTQKISDGLKARLDK